MRWLTSRVSVCGLCALIMMMCTSVRVAADTAFTFQGRLTHNGEAANGAYDLTFSLWDAPSAGNQVGSTIVLTAVDVVEGLFNVPLDFGAGPFDNTGRWLEIAVDSTTLTPRQPITRVPYAIQTRGIVVDEDDNVGIGTTVPASALHVMSGGPVAARIESSSTSGARGLHAMLTANSLGTQAAAVRAEVLSTGVAGQGVWASHNGSGWGVYGTSVNGRGVFGHATGTAQNYGVLGSSDGVAGAGVYGAANEGTSTNSGVFGLSSSTAGRGVSGIAAQNTGATFGVWGESRSPTGRGVFGYATASSGQPHGVSGQTDSTNGRGVFGLTTASSGTNYAVFGQTHSTSGLGVYGVAINSSGTNYGVYGQSNSPTGWDFFAGGAGGNYGAPSSIRWKKNIEPIADALSKLARLRGVTFDWDDAHGGHHDVGMIAEEVGAVLPEIVTYEENGIDATGMDYSRLTPLLVEAVNALRLEKDTQIAELQSENRDLRDRLAQLEALVEDLVRR